MQAIVLELSRGQLLLPWLVRLLLSIHMFDSRSAKAAIQMSFDQDPSAHVSCTHTSTPGVAFSQNTSIVSLI